MNELIDVHAEKGVLVTTSRNVAEVFGKNHADVVRDVRNILSNLSNTDKNWGIRNFADTPYTHPQNGQTYSEYLITKDGLTLLVMGYTGPKAMQFKLAYINRFNEMEAQLQSGNLSIERKLNAAKIILEPAGIEGNQLTLALDKVYKANTGESLLEQAGVQLIAPTQERLVNPTDLGRSLGLSAVKVNLRLAEMGYQIRRGKEWELTEKGKAAGGVYLDTSKKHGNGTPIRQIKWPSTLERSLREPSA